MKPRILLLQLGILVFVIAIVVAQDYDVTVTNVTVWVRATDRSGKPIIGLKKEDFEVFEDNQRVTLTCFEEVQFPAPTSSPAQSEKDSAAIDEMTQKRIVLLVDLSTTSQAEFLHLNKNARDFFLKLQGEWEGMLVSLLPQGIIEVNVQPTTNFERIEAALENLRANSSRDMEIINNRRMIKTFLDRLDSGRSIPGGVEKACNMAREFAQRDHLNALGWLGSLQEFEKYLTRDDSNMHSIVVLLSGGISANPGKHYYDLVRESLLAQRTVGEDEAERFPVCEYEETSGIRKQVDKTIAKLNRHNITFYTVNSRGPINLLLDTVMESGRMLQKSNFTFLDDYEDHMAQIATQTGGTYFENSLNFRFGFEKIVTDLNHQYLLCYTPPQRDEPGQHSIKVAARRSDVKLRHRNGYAD